MGTNYRHTWVFVYTLTATAFCLHQSLAQPPRIIDSSPLAEPLQVALPAELFTAVGVETNIYFDNLILALNPGNYTFDVTCTKGIQQTERWTWTPTANDVGEVPLQIDLRDDQNRIVSQAKTVVKVAPLAVEQKRKRSLLLIGDSLTHASVYSQHLLDRTGKEGAIELTLIGSHFLDPKNPANRHEGYGGWTAERFATHFTETARQGDYAKRGSPFLYKQNDGPAKLDFSQFCKDVNNGQFPDDVTIFLGPNDIFSFNDDTIGAGIQNMLKHYDTLIEMIHASSQSTRIGVMLPVPPTISQDAFGSNYASGQTRWQYRRNQHALVKAMIKRYADRQSSGIQLIATHVNLDCVHNYPTQTVPANAYSDQKIVRQSNAVHPSESGYRQIGDSVYGWLLSH